MNILITGATSGIGMQLATDYNNSNEVWATGRNESALHGLKEKNIHTIRIDLTDRAATLKSFSQIPSLDLAILNAGSCEYIDLPTFDSTLVQRVIRNNVDTVAISIEAVLPLLRKSSAPHLAVVSSSASYLPLPRAEAYGASKAAVSYLVETLRIGLRKEKIAVSLINPGFVKTPLTDRNDFPMPFRISVEEASSEIRRGLRKRKAEIHFPKKFTYLLKLLSMLPEPVWTRIACRMVQS